MALSSFLIAHMPRLVSFNDMAISSVDRRNAEQQWLSMDSWRNKAIKTFQNRVPTTTAFGSTEKESKGEDSGNVESSAPVPSISAESGDFDTVVIQRAKPSSLASLLKHSREYNTGNSPLKSQTPVNPPPPSPWQQSAQNHIAYNVFSQEFDRLVHAIIFDTLKDLPKPA